MNSFEIPKSLPGYRTASPSLCNSFRRTFLNGWKEIHPNFWQPIHLLQWLAGQFIPANHIDTSDFSMENFACLSGRSLVLMRRNDFMKLEPLYGGAIYDAFRQICENFDKFGEPDVFDDDESSLSHPEMSSNDSNSEHTSGSCPEEAEESILLRPVPVCCTDTLPNKSSKSRNGKGMHLWQFILELLRSSEFNPALIKWEDEESGIFKFVNTKGVAYLWGKKRNRTNMNYEKLSRALRHYYKKKILEPMNGRRLVYKFGPKAIGWKYATSATLDTSVPVSLPATTR